MVTIFVHLLSILILVLSLQKAAVAKHLLAADAVEVVMVKTGLRTLVMVEQVHT
jgi:hypothetical protein